MKSVLTSATNSNRIFGLDLLRAFAILGVVAGHGNELLPAKLSHVISKFLFFDRVGMFFVLSGFLVGGIFIRTVENKGLNRNVMIDFWTRRWWRTLPAYFFVLALLIIAFTKYNATFSIKTVWQYPLFLQNFATPIPSFFTESWSLAVQEWFYLLMPLMIALCLKLTQLSFKKAIILFSVLIIFLCTLLRLYRYSLFFPSSQFDEYRFYVQQQVVTRMDGIIFGLLAAFIKFYYPRYFLQYKNKLFIVGIFTLLYRLWLGRFFPENIEAYTTSMYWWVLDFTLVSVATVFLLPFLSEWKSAKGVFYRFVTTVSILSYSMYLLNSGVIQGIIINTLIPWNRYFENIHTIIVVRYLLYWLLVFLLSLLMYQYIELPVIKLRNRYKLRKKATNG